MKNGVQEDAKIFAEIKFTEVKLGREKSHNSDDKPCGWSSFTAACQR
ncbi:hypothetical protein VCSRO66_1773 [Vibrio cholerae]|nr:hypothetical protein VCSRO66_1773 [Vibrio cholerae]